MTLSGVVLGFLATGWYALDEYVAVRRNAACQKGQPRAPRVFWCAAYGLVIGVGAALIFQSRWFIIPLVLGAAIGAWPNPR